MDGGQWTRLQSSQTPQNARNKDEGFPDEGHGGEFESTVESAVGARVRQGDNRDSQNGESPITV